MTEATIQAPESVSTEQTENGNIGQSNTDQTADQGAEKQQQDAQPEAAPSNTDQFTPQDLAAINKFMKKWNVPKGVEPVFDKSGNFGFAVKIKGQSYFVTPDNLIRGFNLNQAGYEMMESAKKKEQEVNARDKAIIEGWTKNKSTKELAEALKRQGIDFDEFAIKHLEDKTKYMNMSPEERAQQEYQQKLDERERQIKEQEAQVKDMEYKIQLNKIKEKNWNELREAMNKHGFDKLVKSNGDEAAEIMYEAISIKQAHKAGGHDLSFYDALAIANQKFKTSFNRMLSQYDPEHIIKMLPDHILEAVRKASISKLNGQPTADSIDIGKRVNLPKYPNNKPKAKIKLSDW